MPFYALVKWDGPSANEFGKYVAASLAGQGPSPDKLQKAMERARNIAIFSVSKRERQALRDALQKNTLNLEQHARYRGIADIGKVFQMNRPKAATGRGMTRGKMISALATAGSRRPMFGKLSAGIRSKVDTKAGSSRIGFLAGVTSESWQSIVADLQAGDTGINDRFGGLPSQMRRYWGALGMPLSQERELSMPKREVFEPIMTQENIPQLLEDRMIKALDEVFND
jgi:hypothetical protein